MIEMNLVVQIISSYRDCKEAPMYHIYPILKF